VPMVAFSAKTGAGKEELWQQILASLPQSAAFQGYETRSRETSH
jgi:hypothetical protein